METSFSSDHFNLAQIPTDQREHEYHLSVQTQSLHDEGLLQMRASQPYNPWSENWTALRSNVAPESMTPFQQPGYSRPWDATSLEPLEFSPRSRAVVPENTHLPPFYSISHHSTPSIGLLRESMAQSHLRASRLHHGDDLLDWQSDPVPSSFYARDSFYCHPAQLETSEGNSLALRRTPPSPPISISSQQSSSISVDSMGPTVSNTGADSSSPRTSSGDHSDVDHGTELPYSKLIYRALKEADGHRLSLQQIYEWFTKNTSKGKDQTKGWQNSIRHNLSMNKGFEAQKVEGSTGKKPQNLWALTQDSIDKGSVESTTRYRKLNDRKGTSIKTPGLGRQRSGSKGRKAAKNSAKMRHPTQHEQRRDWHYSPTQHRPQHPQPQPSVDHHHHLPTQPLEAVSHYQVNHIFDFNGLPMDTRDSPLQQEFDYSNVIGCTSPPLSDVFCDFAEPQPDYKPTLDMGHMGCWYELPHPIMG